MPLFMTDDLLKKYISENIDADEIDYSYKRCIQHSSLTTRIALGALAGPLIAASTMKHYCLVKTHKRLIIIGLNGMLNVKLVKKYNFDELTEYKCKNGMLMYTINISSKSGDVYAFKTNVNYHGDIEPFLAFNI